MSCSLTFGSDLTSLLGFPLQFIFVQGFMKPIGDMAAAHFNKIDLQHSVHLCALSHICIYIYIFNLQNICTCHHPLDTNAVNTSFKCKRGKSHVTTCDCAKPWEGTMAVVRRAKQIV